MIQAIFESVASLTRMLETELSSNTSADFVCIEIRIDRRSTETLLGYDITTGQNYLIGEIEVTAKSNGELNVPWAITILLEEKALALIR